MKKKLLVVFSTIIVLSTMVLSSCSNVTPTVVNTNTPSSTSTPSPTVTPTIIPTPTRPSIPAPVVPEVSAKISAENIDRFSRLTSLGEGDILNMLLSPDGKWIVFGTSNGVLILDSTTLEKILFLPTTMKPEIISFIEDGKKLTARDYHEGYVWSFPDGTEILNVKFKWREELHNNCSWSACDPLIDSKWEYAFTKTTDDGFAALYRISDGEVQFSLNYKIDNYYFSPDGKLIAITTPEKLAVLNSPDGSVVKEFLETGIKWAFFFPDGKRLGVVFGNKVVIYNMDTFLEICTLKVSATSVIFSPDNSIIAFLANGWTQLFVADNLQRIDSVLPGQLIFSPSSKGFLVNDGKGTINYYVINSDLMNIDLHNSYSGTGTRNRYGGSILPEVFSSDSTKILISKLGSIWDSRVLIYDLNDGSELHNISLLDTTTYFPDLRSAIWLPSINSYGIIVDNQGHAPYFGILDVETGLISKIINDKPINGSALEFSPLNNLLVSLQGDRAISWDIKNNGYWQLPFKWSDNSPYIKPPAKIGFTPDEKIFYISENNDQILFFNSSDYSFSNDLLQKRTFFLGNGVIGSTDGSTINIFDSNLNRQISYFTAENIDFDYNNTKNLLATVSGKGLYVWDLSTPNKEKQLFSEIVKNDKWSYNGKVKISPDGNYVAVNNIQGTGSDVVDIYDTTDGTLLYKVGGGSIGETFAFSPDSSLIAVGFDTQGGNQVSIYDLSNGKSIFSTGDYFCEGRAPQVSFSPEGNYLAIMCLYGYPQIWGIR